MIAQRLTRSLAAALVCAGTASAQNTAPPETMKALRIHAHGETNDVLRYEDAPLPGAPGPGQVLIRVHAAGVIPGDWKSRNGRFGDVSRFMPFVMGYDASGVVESVGDGVTDLEPGDEVFGYLTYGGAFAEYAISDASVFAIKPENVPHEEAAGAPVSALAAWFALVERAELKAGQTVLIQAGAGGVGHYAVQIARSIGAEVYTTASPRNHEFLRALGATKVIDYRTQNFEDVVDDVDVVFDMIGGDVLERSYGVVKPGGYLVAITAQPDPDKLEAHGIRGSFLATPPDGAALAKVAQLLASGEVKTHISKVYDLSDAADAIAENEKGHTRGKLVIKIR